MSIVSYPRNMTQNDAASLEPRPLNLEFQALVGGGGGGGVDGVGGGVRELNILILSHTQVTLITRYFSLQHFSVSTSW